MRKIRYHKLPGFEGVYLEDSYVLDIQTEPDCVDIFLEAVLTEKHPRYMSPKLNEQYCYRNAHIYFPNVEKVTWGEKSMTLYKDANGEIDYGNIDTFYFVDGRYHLAGDWGALDIVSSKPIFEIADKIPFKNEEQNVSAKV